MTILRDKRMPIIGAFIVKLRLVLAELARPDAMQDNWFVWSAGQAAHVAIGVALAGGLSFVLSPIIAFTIAVLGYAMLKEVPDFLQNRSWANARDCTQDALFVTTGAALAIALKGEQEQIFFVALSGVVAGLALGIYSRIKS